MATSLNQLGFYDKVIATCMNLTNQPIRLKARLNIDTFTEVEEK